MWRLGAWGILELSTIGDCTDGWQNPAMSPHTPNKTGTRHTDTQWRAEGGQGKEPKKESAKHSTCNAPSSYDTDK